MVMVLMTSSFFLVFDIESLEMVINGNDWML
jgi:hypothetical protein